MFQVVGFDQLVEAMEDAQVFMGCRACRLGVGAQAQQADHDQPCEAVEGGGAPCPISVDLTAQRLEELLQPLGVASQGDTGRTGGKAGVGVDQTPYQLLAHRQHMPIGIGFGDKA